MLKFIYSLFLGILLVIFVGMGVASFYPSPKPPVYPATTHATDPTSAEQKMIDQEYTKKSDTYNEQYQTYSRNVSIIVLAAALVLLVLSLGLHSRIDVLADGLLIGGTLTLIYSIVRSFGGENPRYSFGVVSIGIVVTLIVGYLKFVKPMAAATAGAGKTGKKKK